MALLSCCLHFFWVHLNHATKDAMYLPNFYHFFIFSRFDRFPITRLLSYLLIKIFATFDHHWSKYIYRTHIHVRFGHRHHCIRKGLMGDLVSWGYFTLFMLFPIMWWCWSSIIFKLLVHKNQLNLSTSWYILKVLKRKKAIQRTRRLLLLLGLENGQIYKRTIQNCTKFTMKRIKLVNKIKKIKHVELFITMMKTEIVIIYIKSSVCILHGIYMHTSSMKETFNLGKK